MKNAIVAALVSVGLAGCAGWFGERSGAAEELARGHRTAADLGVVTGRVEALEERITHLERVVPPPPPRPIPARAETRMPVYGVHLASYRTHEDARLGWEVLLDRHKALRRFDGPHFVEVDLESGHYVRLIASDRTNGSRELARFVCQLVDLDGGYCRVVRLGS